MEDADDKRFIYEFGKFTLDPQERTLLVDGQPVHLPAKEFETLLLLVENSGHALSREDIISAVWKESFVEEGNLSLKISHLRKIFNGNDGIKIETIPKHGYRFSAKVNQIFPATETILEKRTVKTLTVKLENETPDAPPALPPKPRGFWGAGLLAALILIVFILGGVYWFAFRQPTAKPAENKILYLTDGQFDIDAPYWTNDGRIFFAKFVSKTRAEMWTMNADGTNQRRAETGIKDLRYGNWSPDGNKIFFWKDGDDKSSYLADADGTNEIVLSFRPFGLAWSPDGSQIVYAAKDLPEEDIEIFIYTLKTNKSVKLTDNDHLEADPSFSPDGKQIAFLSGRDGNWEIYLMNTDGSNVRRLTNHPAADNMPCISPDGTQMAFQSNRENEQTQVYLLNLNDDSPPRKLTDYDTQTAVRPRCWSEDGTQILVQTTFKENAQILLINVELYSPKLLLSDENAELNYPRLSPDGKQILYQAQTADLAVELRLTDLETKKTKTIFKTEPNQPQGYPLSPAFSPDSGRIAFGAKKDGNTEVFIVNADGGNLQNLSNSPLLDSNPVFSPDRSEIIFQRASFELVPRLYRMNADGSNQRHLTEQSGYELTPAFSPDGSMLAFSGDKTTPGSRGLDIFLLNFRNPNEEKRLTARRFHDVHPEFSPDGKRIVFHSNGDGNNEIYLMNADGTGLFRLTRTKADESAPQFSKDGKRLIFSSNQSGKFALYEIELP